MYTPKTWVTGETITAAELNALEQAAAGAAVVADAGTPGTATGDALRAAYVALIGNSNGTDDTSRINALLDAARQAGGGYVRGTPGQTYIATTLVIGSSTVLDMTGCTIRLKSGVANTNLLNNRAVTTARTVMDLVTTASSTTVTSATAAFAAGDAGRAIYIYGAGADGRGLSTTIASVTNSTTAVLAAAPAVALPAGRGSIGTRDVEFRVTGGTWDQGGDNDTAGVGGHLLRFRRADRFRIDNVTIAGSLGRYSIAPGDCNDFLIDTIGGFSPSAFVQVNGPATGGTIRHIRGTSLDDTVSLTPNDWSGFNDVHGDITDILIEDIAPIRSDNTVVKVLGGSAGTAARRVTIRDIGGFCTSLDEGTSTEGLVYIGDDAGEPTTAGGFIDAISVENVHGFTKAGVPCVKITGANVGSVHVNGIVWRVGVLPLSLGGPAGAPGTLTSLTVENVVAEYGVTGQLIYGTANLASIGDLTVRHVSIPSWAASDSIPMIVTQCPITTLTVEDFKLFDSAGGYIVAPYANVTHLNLSRVTLNVSSGFIYAISVQPGVAISDLAISDTALVASGSSSGRFLALNGSGGAVSTARFAGVTSLNGGGLIDAIAATSLPLVYADNVVLTNTLFTLGGVATTTTWYLTNVTGTPTANIIYIPGGAHTIFAQNCSFDGKSLQGPAGAVHSRTLGFPIDVSDPCLAKSTNDLAFNTNGSLSCGAGPVGYNGTAWKHLITGATY